MRFPDILVPATAPPPPESPRTLRRRRLVVAVTLLVGAALLAATLATSPPPTTFAALGVLLAATWTVGALLAGPLTLGRQPGRKPAMWPLSAPVAVGVVAAALFVGARRVAPEIPWLERSVENILATADARPVGLVLAIAVANGVAEELFFRGALYSAVATRRPALASTIAYVVVTVATGNAALVIAAVVMGTLFALERASTGGILAPLLTHATWSVLMVLALPR